jgi:hypothetical protein
MSEYQYYEFRAVDRPLSKQEMGALRAISSRAEIAPTSFVNTHNWGDFKGNPDALMKKYFDAFVYVANWGTQASYVCGPEPVDGPLAATQANKFGACFQVAMA